tara:strand:- start:112 stop:336 length:225 start_codon:yes stop_codon:yes gene_type:complete
MIQTFGFIRQEKLDRIVKIRNKQCNECSENFDVLFRCQYDNSDWMFLCQECLTPVKEKHLDYVYGGTWKAKKDQ